MKIDCNINDFQPGDMVTVKKGWSPSQGQHGFVETITINPPCVRVRHEVGKTKDYKPEELKNLTGGDL